MREVMVERELVSFLLEGWAREMSCFSQGHNGTAGKQWIA